MLRTEIVEREGELDTLRALLEEAALGRGRLVLLEGPAGIGKTRLLQAARELADQHELSVLYGRGSELERDFPFGVARQLLEPALAAVDDEMRAALFSGAARHAQPLFDAVDTAAPVQGDPDYATLHGLFWLVWGLARRRPLLALVDDLQWADAPSLRFLTFLAGRLDGVRALLACALRPEEAIDPALVSGLTMEPQAERLRPRPLSTEGTASFVRAELGAESEPAFVAACHETTGGNPFYLRELLADAAASDLAPTAANAGRVPELGAEGVARLLLRRLDALRPSGVELARAVAVLGDRTPLALAAALAELDVGSAAATAAALAGASLLTGAAELTFVHPLARSAIYASIPAPERADRHTRAARLLIETGAAPERIAAQLVHVPPSGDQPVVAQLRAAATAARARGAPSVAAELLGRALAEPPAAEGRWAVLAELGDAEQHSAPHAGIAHLREALDLAPDPPARGRIGLGLGHVLLLAADARGAYDAVERASVGLGPEERELSLQLEMLALLAAGCHVELAGAKGKRAVELAHELKGETPGERAALGQAAFYAASAGLQAEPVVALARRSLGEGAGTLRDRPEPVAAGSPLLALMYVERLAETVEHATAAVEHFTGLGSRPGFVMATTIRAEARLRQGALADAEADARLALDTWPDLRVPAWEALALASLVRALIERGDLARAARELAVRAELPGELEGTAWGAILGHARACLAFAGGDLDEAVGELGAASEIFTPIGSRGIEPIPWIKDAALVRLARGEHAEAEALAARGLAAARAGSLPGAVGEALRVMAHVSAPVDVEALEQSVTAYADSERRLDRAHALCDLGAALRRANRRQEARKPLAEALEIAHRCGATALDERATTELRAAGARPRRPVRTGVDALTASERRTAELAASGMTNAAIAQALFVTVKTVEGHLSGAYRKLDVRSRGELPGTLEAS